MLAVNGGEIRFMEPEDSLNTMSVLLWKQQAGVQGLVSARQMFRGIIRCRAPASHASCREGPALSKGWHKCYSRISESWLLRGKPHCDPEQKDRPWNIWAPTEFVMTFFLLIRLFLLGFAFSPGVPILKVVLSMEHWESDIWVMLLKACGPWTQEKP